ncbi:hypothetical protein G6F56_014586 [Rhizopus delemar]|nr:hypothetical protein G6F56_014586 [Rhizopus delemar]
MTGPTSVPDTVPPLTFRVLALVTRSCTQPRASPTSTRVEAAMQRWPEAPQAPPTIALRVLYLLESGSTTAWVLAAIMT